MTDKTETKDAEEAAERFSEKYCDVTTAEDETAVMMEAIEWGQSHPTEETVQPSEAEAAALAAQHYEKQFLFINPARYASFRAGAEWGQQHPTEETAKRIREEAWQDFANQAGEAGRRALKRGDQGTSEVDK